MNRKILAFAALAAAALACANPLLAAGQPQSLRGANAIDELSALPAPSDWAGKTGRIARSFDVQPPLIPHNSQNHRIDREGNRCLGCHALDKYEKRKAVRISDSHYRDRDGKPLQDVSAARYFCTQCHVEQRDAAPLVANEFSTADQAD